MKVFEVARYGFSGSIPPNFGHNLLYKWVIASFRCYYNSDVIATLIITNFHLYLIKRDLIQLLWQFFQISVYVNVVYAETWEVLTPKNPIEAP